MQISIAGSKAGDVRALKSPRPGGGLAYANAAVCLFGVHRFVKLFSFRGLWEHLSDLEGAFLAAATGMIHTCTSGE